MTPQPTRPRCLRWLCTAFTLLVLAFTFVAPASTPHVGAVAMFTDAGKRFAFVVPDSWTPAALDGPNAAAAYTGSDPFGFFVVSAYPASPGASLDDLMALTINQMAKTVNDYRFIQSQTATLGGDPARQVIFSGANNGTTFAAAQFVAIHGDTVYIATFGALPLDVDGFREQARVPLMSWKFL